MLYLMKVISFESLLLNTFLKDSSFAALFLHTKEVYIPYTTSASIVNIYESVLAHLSITLS